ncbi:MAG TPA: hypothetical protein VGQ76_22380 [Thermoanaerobaculia bacterium]|nr:hypothetical protein [Thermoanaerobaculia bacterium]
MAYNRINGYIAVIRQKQSMPWHGDHMGLFWDLMQQSQLKEHETRAGSLEARVAALEAELADTRQILSEALRRLESKFCEDLNSDGRIG